MRTLEQQIHDKCVHFNGIQHDECEAGVRYDDVRVDGCGLPCLRGGILRGGENIPCDKRRWPTEAEINDRVEEIDNSMTQSFLGMKAVIEDANERGFGKGHGGAANVPCPVCDDGTISYSVSGYNGHRHARCSTVNCVAFME